ncbi:MerR family transcriptional regulator [Aliikangiella sp. G2MR2-5]|uniref:MerR family transcriptional regulator n=1 Tax=Aliikangiella sp. G2MR2-5 TaxID=2788943 RepID=UPI0018ABDD35|nr:MerR family transcriptional regulator [Aliikangiella sp. G2MR2-5]
MAWKIGEVVKRTGLTARALHFYEEQGLVGPISRNDAGHRIYKSSDLLKLQQIGTLRQLGVALAEMPAMLNNEKNLVPQLKKQLHGLQQQRKVIQQIEDRIFKLLEKLETESIPSDDLDDFIFKTLESMTMYEKYFNQNEIDQIHNREHLEDSNETFDDVWGRWLEQLQLALDSGLEPDSKQVQDLMGHWQEMTRAITQNDKKKLNAFNELLYNEPQARKEHGISDELFEFMSKASKGH